VTCHVGAIDMDVRPGHVDAKDGGLVRSGEFDTRGGGVVSARALRGRSGRRRAGGGGRRRRSGLSCKSGCGFGRSTGVGFPSDGVGRRSAANGPAGGVADVAVEAFVADNLQKQERRCVSVRPPAIRSWRPDQRLAYHWERGEDAEAHQFLVGVLGQDLDGGESDVDGRIEGEGADQVREDLRSGLFRSMAARTFSTARGGLLLEQGIGHEQNSRSPTASASRRSRAWRCRRVGRSRRPEQASADRQTNRRRAGQARKRIAAEVDGEQGGEKRSMRPRAGRRGWERQPRAGGSPAGIELFAQAGARFLVAGRASAAG